MRIVKCLIFLVIVFYLNTEVNTQTRTCLTTYSNIQVYGNDLNGVQGKSSDCCYLCQQKQGCRSYTWDSFNGGTCWLKSATQPLATSNGSFTGIMSLYANETYSLNQTYAAPNFFDAFHFDTWHLTPETNNVNRSTAEQLGMIGYQNGKVYMGVEHTKVYNISYEIRPSVQIQSKYLYNSGLFILSLDHMPTGIATWPAFWTYGPKWPNQGEIDILEGYFNRTYNVITIHVGDDCVMQQNTSNFFTGSWDDIGNKPFLDCYQNANASTENASFSVTHGCSIKAPDGTFNVPFNQAGGGVFAMQWDGKSFIKIWNFVKPNIPDDITRESPNPNPDTWGLPAAHFQLGPNCSPDHFLNQTITFDIALCGGFAYVFYPGGIEACNEAVKFHPEMFTEAYWLINYLKLFCKPGEPCGFYEPQCEFGC